MAATRRPMIGLVLVGVGCFCIVLGLTARYYLFPHLAVLPLDRYERTESRAENATYVDQSTGAERRGRTLVALNTLRGNVRASTPDIAVWESFTVTTDAGDGATVGYARNQVAIERHSGEAVSCCGQSIDGEQYIDRSGLVYQWPYYTQKTRYQYFDEAVRKPLPISYQRTEKLYGLAVYRFEQRVAPTRLATLDVPGSLVGEPQKPTVKAERWYADDRVFWVEPRTGIVVKAANHRHETLRNSSGQDALTLFDGNVVLSDKDVHRFVDIAADAKLKIGLLHTTAYWAGLILGAGLAIVGAALWLAWRPRRVTVPAPEFTGVPEPVA